MVDYTFNTSGTTTISNFAFATDVLIIPSTAGSAANFTIVQSGSDVRITNGTATTILTGVAIETLATSNVTFANGSKLYIGDGTTSTLLDSLGQAAATFVLGTGNDQVQGLGGNDTMTTSDTVGGDKLLGNTGDDSITAAAGANGNHSIYGGAGSDLITVIGGGANLIRGDNNGDAISLTGSGNNDLNGNAGNDTITLNTGANGANTVHGGQDADSITLTAATGINTVYGDNGADTISLAAGATGNNFGYGGSGNDSIASAGTGNNTFNGNAGADTISITGAGANTIYGGQDADSLIIATTATGNNVIYGDLGDDTITGTYGGAAVNNTIYGGTGTDVFRFNFTAAAHRLVMGDFASTDIVQATLSGGATAAGLTVTGLGSSLVVTNGASEQIAFSGYTGDLSSTNFVLSDSTVLATNGSTTAGSLTGGAGADQLVSGDAGDVLTGGSGADKMLGNAGDDIFLVSLVADHAAGETVTGGSGTDYLRLNGTTAGTLTVTASTDVERIEIATGSSTTGVFTGTTASSIDASATTVWGGTQTGVWLQGNDAINTLTASTTGNDTVIGGGGVDVIALGGAGNGNDVVGYIQASDVASNNTITNFNFTNDQIGFASSLVTSAGSVGNLATTYYGEANITSTAAADNGLVTTAFEALVNKATVKVLVLVDNDGGAQAFTSADIDTGLKNSSATGAMFIAALLDDASATAATLYYDPNTDNDGDIVLVGTITTAGTNLTLANADASDFYVLS